MSRMANGTHEESNEKLLIYLNDAKTELENEGIEEKFLRGSWDKYGRKMWYSNEYYGKRIYRED